ncbi:CHASE domain-containing protein [Paracnuella aquatica]|uniref:sensor histidine kinase n=1 Tax=Paracnuella aquatica TaxID=2268757 RepID=UPI000F5174C4|nr:CHASE domain-containing protein [Paracnuella aquatica]RPD49022.1 PAS domain S-box protein [Paracnuella aquatica]
MSELKPKSNFNQTITRTTLLGGLFVCSVVITLVAWYISYSTLKERTADRFDYTIGNIQSAIQERMAAYKQVLRSAVGFYYAADTITRAEWSRYVQTLQLEKAYPGIQGVGFTIRLSPDEVPEFTQKVMAEGYPMFRVWPEHAREEYHSILYLAPFTGRNLRAFGYDMFTEQHRRAAMERARDSGDPAASQMVTLVQEIGSDVQKGCLIYLPVYRPNMSLATVADRRAALKGFVYSPFRINDLMRGILGSVDTPVEFEMYDGRNTDTTHLFYASNGYNAQKSSAAFSTPRYVTVGGNQWTVVFTSRPNFVSRYELRLPNIIAIAGIIVNVLLLFILMRLSALSKKNRVLAEQYKAEKDRYEIVSLSTNDIIWEWDIAANTVTCNKNFEVVLGYPLPDEPFSFASWISYVHPEDRAGVVTDMQAFTKGDQKFWSGEYRLQKKDGTAIYILDRGRLIFDAAGKPASMVGSMINITERKMAEDAQRRFNEELEQTVQARTLELQRSNEDLERFAHVASHDLKEPVRKMRTGIDLVKIRYQNVLGDGVALIDRLAKSASRLNQMIESILAYSTVKFEAQNAEAVDLNEVLHHVTDDLELVISEKDAQVNVHPLPIIEGSPVLLHQLFYNLVNNALKFTRAGVKPVVTIESKPLHGSEQDWVEIRLSDNGIGFNEEEATKIFHSFVRLHPKDVFEGTGLGLALCKRVVERHGGTITATGQPGHGATFILTFPAKQHQGLI